MWAISLNQNEDTAVTFSVDNTIKVWRLPGWSLVRTIDEQSVVMYDGAIAPDGKLGISGHDDGTLKVWDLTRDSLQAQSVRHSRAVYDTRVSPDGRFGLTAAADDTVGVWDLATHTRTLTLRGHSEAVWRAIFHPDNTRILTASADRTLKLWDRRSGDLLHTFTGHRHSIRAADISTDGLTMVSGSTDGELRVWNLRDSTLRHVLPNLPQPDPDGMGYISSGVRDLIVVGTGQAVSAHADGTLRLWDIDTGQQIMEVAAHDCTIEALARCPYAFHLLSAAADGSMKLWELQNNTLRFVRDYNDIHDDKVWDVFICSDARTAVSTSSDHTVKVWDTKDGAVLAAFSAEAVLLTCDLLLDQGMALVGSRSGAVHFLRLHRE